MELLILNNFMIDVIFSASNSISHPAVSVEAAQLWLRRKHKYRQTNTTTHRKHKFGQANTNTNIQTQMLTEKHKYEYTNTNPDGSKGGVVRNRTAQKEGWLGTGQLRKGGG